MAAVSRVFGACRVLMTKAASSSGVSSGRAGTGILKVVPVSQPLAKFIGENEVSRTIAVKKIWEYIKLHNLQNPANKREILCDGKLKTIFPRFRNFYLNIFPSRFDDSPHCRILNMV